MAQSSVQGADFKGATFESCTLNGEKLDPLVLQALGATGLGDQIMAARAAEREQAISAGKPQTLEAAIKGLSGVCGGAETNPADLGQFARQADLPNEATKTAQMDRGSPASTVH